MNALLEPKACCVAVLAAAGCFAIFTADAFAQQAATSGVTEVERVIVTGSNIPSAQEVGPNPVDTYPTADIETLGIRNATDLTTFRPQQSGATMNLNMASGPNGVDGTVQFNLGGLLAKETLVLVDGVRRW